MCADQPTRPAYDAPPLVPLAKADLTQRFRFDGASASVVFEPQDGAAGRVLIVSFDNLATIDEGRPRPPWMQWRIKRLGYSNLGVQSHAKDWFRCTDAPDLLTGLRARGFFDRFDRIVLLGASMGAFGAINYAPLLPKATVLAFSAQSTMSRDIAPFEQRFRFSVRKSNWSDPAYLDAADALPHQGRVILFYDPHVPEDNAHAKRLNAPNVEQIKVPHCTHEAIRVFVKSEAFFPLLQGIVETDGVTPAFWQAWRQRRTQRKWLRALIETLDPVTHPKRTQTATQAILRFKDMWIAKDRLQKAETTLAERKIKVAAAFPTSQAPPADSTKNPMGAMTMVGGDHFFLQRWVDYYGKHLGRENLYILSHGGDPEHKRIAKGANVIYLPYDATRYCFNQRRWQMLSLMTTAFTRYYDWML
jgi:hypothetical protein